MFYGWWIVCCTFSVLFIAYGIQFSFGAMLPAISADLAWDRATLSMPYALYVFLYGFLGIVSGPLTDRYGPRAVIAGGALLLGLGWGFFSFVELPWHVYAAVGLIAAMGMSAVFVPCNATVVRWFVRRRGLAVSLSSSGASFGNMLVPPLVTWLLQFYDWRTTYLGLAVVGGLLIFFVSLFIVRDPESRGLRPDGDGVSSQPGSGDTPIEEAIWQLAEARRTSVLWILTAIFMSTWLVIFTPMVHLPAGAIDLGLRAIDGAYLLSAIGAGGIFGRLSTGVISDHIGRRPALAGVLALQAIAFVLFARAEDYGVLAIGSLLFGFSYGGGTVLFPAIVADYFGRASAGAIVGFIFGIAGAAAAFGPPFAGWLYDSTGSYSLAYWVCAGSNASGIALLLLLPKTAPKPAA